MVTDEELSRAVEALFDGSNPNSNGYAFTTINGVVQELESKLGHGLSSKVDFIRAQMQLLFRSQPPPPPPPPPAKDHFALHRNPNFHPGPSPVSSAFLSFSAQPVPQQAKPEAPAAVVAEPPTLLVCCQENGGRSAKAVGEKKRQLKFRELSFMEIYNVDTSGELSAQTKATKRKGGPGGLNKLCGVSPELQAIVGQPALPRTEIVKQLWAYIRKHNLQDPSNKRKIICNDELRLVFETDCTDMFKMNKLLAKHIISLEPTKQSGSKKPKVDPESVPKSTESGPSVIISEALATFFGVGGREMLQSEVLRRIWEYIKLHNLEDPTNSMSIKCDANLQELFGCESICALGIPDVLGRHHILRTSC
ncbi:Upstream activation factor subunit spp27 [Morella rubra]|uniref:Upstream activation factor subunit spp27 n=1 Tax=Morella rubra TaxID=262757 RepID=A0A6A1WNS3_9ROSI|nr:Upstream activation factor subunit spp27 [Morella rubra]